MLNGAWQWPQPGCDVECQLTGETERVMFLILWGMKCKWINGTEFLHTSGNAIFFFRSANIMKTLPSLPLKKHVPFKKWEWNFSNFFPLLLLPFFLEYVGCSWGFLVERLREGNGDNLQTTWLNMIGVNQSSCAKPALVNKSTAALSERINIFVLFSCLCILVRGKKKGSKKWCRIPVCLLFVIYMAKCSAAKRANTELEWGYLICLKKLLVIFFTVA